MAFCNLCVRAYMHIYHLYDDDYRNHHQHHGVCNDHHNFDHGNNAIILASNIIFSYGQNSVVCWKKYINVDIVAIFIILLLSILYHIDDSSPYAFLLVISKKRIINVLFVCLFVLINFHCKTFSYTFCNSEKMIIMLIWNKIFFSSIKKMKNI